MKESNNPYQPPSAEEERFFESGALADYVEATRGQRFVHFLVDNIASGITWFVVAFLVAVMGLPELVRGITGYMFQAVVVAGYFVVFEVTLSATPGKMVTGSKVISMNGQRPTVLQVLGRTAVRFIPFDPLSFLGSGPGWHDGWTNTAVVKAR